MSRHLFARTFFLLGLLVAAAWQIGPSAAQGAAGAANGPTAQERAALDAHWDQLLADHDFIGLGRDLLAPKAKSQLLAGLGWAKDRTLAGGSVVIPLLYSRLLWLVGTHSPQYAGLKDTASMMALYSLVLVAVDGVKCADKSAPGHHYETILMQYRDQLRAAADAPVVTRNNIIVAALGLETKTATLRGDDDYLCRFGLEETQYSLKKHEGEPETEVPPQPGQFGRTVEVPYDKEFQPRFLPREQWQPQQDANRAALARNLAALLDQIKTPPNP